MQQNLVRRAMSHVLRRRSRISPGAPPGTLDIDPEAPQPVVRVMAYGPDAFEERLIENLDDLPAFLDRWPVTWVNVDGLGGAAVIERIGEIFGLHRLALEDIVNVGQRAKAEFFDDHVFMVERMVRFEEHIEAEQVSVLLGPNFVVSFQERPGDCFESVRNRIRSGRKRFRTAGPDYLVYTLLDALVDGYFPVTEKIGERLEALEDEVVSRPQKNTVRKIQEEKANLLLLRRAIRPHLEMLNALLREEEGLFAEETKPYLRDVLDHTMQTIELLESFREVSSDLMNVYLSNLSNKMNEVMKVLTVIATIFIPLGFIAGVYGMNFDPARSPWNMPELRWYWGYPFALGLMVVIAVGLLFFFKRKGFYN